ncbi:phosphatase PAP2 family protein [Lysobacter firmicutimachus]|uniref:Phosphatase PAP2 family protein n=1 Tax=Lysobacter firmicutimachus TaxID=1792846 RepID=A0ABU8D538_9GAMM
MSAIAASPPAVLPWPQRLAVVLAATALGAVVYLGINAHPWRLPASLPRTVMDDAIGWRAWAIWPYWAMLLTGPALALAIRERALFYATLRAFALAAGLNAAIWLAWPTRIARRALPEGLDAWTQAAWRALYALDAPHNCFPSGHITVPAVAAVGFALQYPRARPAAALGLAALAPSVVATGQHYAWDVAGGLATATLGLLLAGAPSWRSVAPPAVICR